MAAPSPEVSPTGPSALDKRLEELGFATWLIALVGSSSLTGFLATFLGGPGAAGLSDVARFISAALGGLALTIGSAIATATLIRGEIQGHAAGAVAFFSLGIGILVANAIGIGTVGVDVVQERLDAASGGPIGMAFALLVACFITYGIVASFQALICGGLLGYWFNLIRDPD